jgi:hypothetical protein
VRLRRRTPFERLSAALAHDGAAQATPIRIPQERQLRETTASANKALKVAYLALAVALALAVSAIVAITAG